MADPSRAICKSRQTVANGLSSIFPMEEILKTARRIRRELSHLRGSWGQDLGGWCAVASGKLFEDLQEHHPRFVVVQQEADPDIHHCFLQIGKWCLDITARQFFHRLPTVWWCEEKSYYSFLRELGYMETVAVCKTREAILFSMDGWDKRFKAFAELA